jgi:hypothetical protein
MKTMGTVLRVMLISWLYIPGCASSPDPEPASGEAVDEVIANPCSFASNGLWCGLALPSPPVPINPNHLYTCRNRLDVGERNCTNGCKINPPGVADQCN